MVTSIKIHVDFYHYHALFPDVSHELLLLYMTVSKE